MGVFPFVLTNFVLCNILISEHIFYLRFEVNYMCMSLRIEPKEMAEVLIKIRKMSFAQEMSIKLGKSLIMSGDLFPSDIAPVLAPNKYGKMTIFTMAGGFAHQDTSKPLANCRVETADTKALWRDSWYRRRCVIPASWYYEWGYPLYEDDNRSMVEHRNTKKIKFAIQTEGSDITYIAGLYSYEDHGGMQVPMFTVLTREATFIINLPLFLICFFLCSIIKG